MEKNEAIKIMKQFFESKNFGTMDGPYGPRFIYERDDIFLSVFVDDSKYYKLVYIEFNYQIKALGNGTYDTIHPEAFAFALNKRIAHIEYEDYILDTLCNQLTLLFETELFPIITDGLNYICSKECYLDKNNQLYRNETLEYLKQYQTMHKIKTKKEKVKRKRIPLSNGGYYAKILDECEENIIDSIKAGFLLGVVGKEHTIPNTSIRIEAFDLARGMIYGLCITNDDEQEKAMNRLREIKRILKKDYQLQLVLI